MSAPKHTPGPWTALAHPNPDLGAEVIGAKGKQPQIASVERAADAPLIAAAPELADALEAMCAAYEEHADRVMRVRYDQARAVLRKAGRLP